MADDKFYRLPDMQERQITPAEYDLARGCLSDEALRISYNSQTDLWIHTKMKNPPEKA